MSERQVLSELPAQLLAHGVLSIAALARRLNRLTDQTINGLEGLLAHGLRSDEREALTLALNRRNGHGLEPRRALFDWERRLFADELPKPPARILLGGAGDGAEALPLRAAGYEVHAFEPAEGCLPPLRAAVGPCGSASVLCYQDLIEAPAERARAEAAARLAARRYDAVLLGWGSLNHVLEPDTRLELMRVLARLCSDGPILLSFVLTRESEPERRSRAFELGARAGEWLARMRSLPQPTAAERERFWAHAGFVHLFSERELNELAEAAGRELVLHDGPYAHAAFRRA